LCLQLRQSIRARRLIIVDIAPVWVGGDDASSTSVRANGLFNHPEGDRASAPRQPSRTRVGASPPVVCNLKRRDDGMWTYCYDVALRQPQSQPAERPDPEPVWRSFRNISCPTLLVRGAESDLLGRPTAERMAREIPNCMLVEVPEAGHSVPLENPEGFRDAVKAWLKG
jgi:pimeloyl-ACP methyl ester carboxylesterase